MIYKKKNNNLPEQQRRRPRLDARLDARRSRTMMVDGRNDIHNAPEDVAQCPGGRCTMPRRTMHDARVPEDDSRCPEKRKTIAKQKAKAKAKQNQRKQQQISTGASIIIVMR